MIDRHPLTQAIIDGDKVAATELTQRCLDEGESADSIVEERLVPGMAISGKQFQWDEIFVPEMLVAANAMKASLTILEPIIAESGVKAPYMVVIGTVQGDLHDIGKDIEGMSALLTTTMPHIRAAVAAVKASGMDTRIVIGGAPVSQEFADEVEADGFAPDAGAAVDIARGLVGAA